MCAISVVVRFYGWNLITGRLGDGQEAQEGMLVRLVGMKYALCVGEQK